MKHKIKVKVPVEKRGLFGSKKTVMEMHVIDDTAHDSLADCRATLFCYQKMQELPFMSSGD